MSKVNDSITLFWNYISGPDLWETLGLMFFRILVILILAFIVVRIGNKVIERLFRKRNHGPIRISVRREETIRRLVRNMLSYVVYFIAGMMIIETFGLPIGSILAGAGVAGLAIGFGAQNLVRDIISGFFIVFEDQFSVGDYVIVSDVEGEVEEIGIRTTKIKSWTGEHNVIPNGNITQVINYSINNSLAVVDINVPYESDISKAEGIIEEVISELPKQHEEFKDKPIIHGIQTLDLSYYVIRVIAETEPVFHWYCARIIRGEVKNRLYSEGIEIPSPRLVMYTRNETPTSLEVKKETDNDQS